MTVSGLLIDPFPKLANSNNSIVSSDLLIEEGLTESLPSNAPSFQCVLESKVSHLSARRSDDTSDPDSWDLSVAGLHKERAGTKPVKRLKHVIFQFNRQEGKFPC